MMLEKVILDLNINHLANHIPTILVLLLCTLGCRQEESSAQAKFVALKRQYGTVAGVFINANGMLINKVHKSKWKITYGFADNKKCNGTFNRQQRTQLKASISRVLQTWLQPLRSKGSIVNSFEFELKKTKAVIFDFLAGAKGIRKMTYGVFGIGKKPDLGIIFNCKEGRAFANMVIKTPPELNMFYREGTAGPYMTEAKKYNITTMLHEVGHAFGLADTYVDSSKSWYLMRYNTSDGGSRGTIGTQPISVMNKHYLVAINKHTGELQLGDDDVAGLHWLYAYYVEKSIGKKDCPADYIYEKSTRGCAPAYPLIFATKHADLAIVAALLDDKSIAIDQQDQLGNTALHYAANRKAMHDRVVYDFLRHHYGARDDIKNKAGFTPADIFAGGEKQRRATFTTTLFELVRHQKNTSNALKIGLNQQIRLFMLNKFIANKSNDINMQDTIGNTMLHYAAIKGHQKLLQTLLQQQNIDVNAQSRVSDETALHKAARYGQPEVAAALLQHADIDIEVQDTWGRTAISRALYEKVRASKDGKTKLADRIQQVASLIRDFEHDTTANIPPDSDIDNNNGNSGSGSNDHTNNCGNPFPYATPTPKAGSGN